MWISLIRVSYDGQFSYLRLVKTDNTQTIQRILWNRLNSRVPIFVDIGFFAHSLGYDFVDTSVFSFSKKTNILQICFRRECKFVRQATHDYLKHLATMNSYDSTVVKNLKKNHGHPVTNS